MRAHRRGRRVDVHHARRRVGKLVRRTHLLLLRLHEGRLPQRPGESGELANVSCVSIVPCEALVALVLSHWLPNSVVTASERAGHRGNAHSPNSRSVSTTSARSKSGSTHRNVPDWPKCPYVRAELADPVQCGDLASLISKPSPQSLGRWTPNPGRTPGRPGNCTVVASPCIRCDTVDGRSRS